MSDATILTSVLIISEDAELVDSLIKNNSTPQEFIVRESPQLLFDNPSILESNSIVIFDIGSNDKGMDKAIDQVLKIKQLDPTQVLILVGESEILGKILKSSIQPLIYRAFTKPVRANQIFLGFKSGNALHDELVDKQAQGIDITAIGPSENRTNVASLSSERKNSTAIYAGIAVAAIIVVAWLLLGDNDETTTPPLIVSDVKEPAETPAVTVSASVQKINQLNQEAATAILEDRIFEPKGDNALEYYERVLAIDAYDNTAYHGKRAIADRLRNSHAQLVADAKFDKALKVIKVLQKIEPLNLQNDALLDDLKKSIDAHVKRIKDTGTSEQVAQTSAVLDKLGDTFAGSRSAAEALKKEKDIVAKIDIALAGNILVPPSKGNAYSLVSDALKSNTVSNANISSRVKALSTKLLRLADKNVDEAKLDDAGKLATLIKRLNVDRPGLAALNKRIKEIREADAAAVAQQEEIVEEPEPPKIIPAKVISRTAPRYPIKALNKEVEGWVQVKFSIDVKGIPINTEVVSAEPVGMFENAALKALAKWRFSPARNEETSLPVESSEITTKIQFRLQ